MISNTTSNKDATIAFNALTLNPNARKPSCIEDITIINIKAKGSISITEGKRVGSVNAKNKIIRNKQHKASLNLLLESIQAPIYKILRVYTSQYVFLAA
jgi:hypothetical protein